MLLELPLGPPVVPLALMLPLERLLGPHLTQHYLQNYLAKDFESLQCSLELHLLQNDDQLIQLGRSSLASKRLFMLPKFGSLGTQARPHTMFQSWGTVRCPSPLGI